MENLNSQQYNKSIYYNAKDIVKLDTLYFKGLTRRVRDIIKKFNLIKEQDYVYYNKSGVIIPTDDYKPATKDQLLLNKKWLVKNVPMLMTNETKKQKLEQEGKLYKYDKAPGILELTDEQKFKDENGNVFEVEVRGERNENNCWFLADDIGKLFNIVDIKSTIEKSKNNHIDQYKYFIVKKKESFHKNNIKLFLNYDGVLHLVYSSYSNTARKFRKWVNNIVFTVQLGTKEQKQQL